MFSNVFRLSGPSLIINEVGEHALIPRERHQRHCFVFRLVRRRPACSIAVHPRSSDRHKIVRRVEVCLRGRDWLRAKRRRPG